MAKSSKWTIAGQGLAVAAVVAIGLTAVSSLPNPAWEVENQAQAVVSIAVGLESKWDPAYVNRLSASDLEGWGLSPRGWRRSGNGWVVGPDGERFEVGTWKESSGKSGFALIFSNINAPRCKEMTRLLGNAFDQYAVNDKGQDCAKDENKVVFYRDPSSA